MAKWTRIAAALILGSTGALAAEPSGGAVRDYEGRLEEIAKEIQDIRRELEQLVQEVVEGEFGRLVLFLQGPAPVFKEKGVALSVDGTTVVSRPLTAAEVDVLSRGLPLELIELRLPAGEHPVFLVPLGEEAAGPVLLKADRGKVSSWVATAGVAGVEWRAE